MMSQSRIGLILNFFSGDQWPLSSVMSVARPGPNLIKNTYTQNSKVFLVILLGTHRKRLTKISYT